MDSNLPPELILLVKASPWAAAFLWAFRELCKLLSPVSCILAVRLARNEKERAALVKIFQTAKASTLQLPRRKSAKTTPEE